MTVISLGQMKIKPYAFVAISRMHAKTEKTHVRI